MNSTNDTPDRAPAREIPLHHDDAVRSVNRFEGMSEEEVKAALAKELYDSAYHLWIDKEGVVHMGDDTGAVPRSNGNRVRDHVFCAPETQEAPDDPVPIWLQEVWDLQDQDGTVWRDVDGNVHVGDKILPNEIEDLTVSESPRFILIPKALIC